MVRDTEEFNNLSRAFSLPKNTEEEKEMRSVAIQDGLKACTMTPLLPTVALSDCFMGVYCFCGTCSVEYSGDESKKLSEGTFLLLNEVEMNI